MTMTIREAASVTARVVGRVPAAPAAADDFGTVAAAGPTGFLIAAGCADGDNGPSGLELNL